MMRLLGLLLSFLLAAALTACGGSGEDSSGDASGDDPAATPSSSGSASDSDSASPGPGGLQPSQVEIVSQTNAGGQVDERAVVLDTQTDVDEFLAELEPGQLTDGVQEVFDARSTKGGETLLGAVVAIGCDVPKDVELTEADGGAVIAITPVKVKATTNQCLAAVTSIAVVTVGDQMPRRYDDYSPDAD